MSHSEREVKHNINKKHTVLTDVKAANTPDAMYAGLKHMGPLGSEVVTAHIQLNLDGGLVACQPK
jgi:hypothetical protein